MSKILIVDDSATIRAALAQAVSSMKFEPVTAESGEQAVELFAAERPSLVSAGIATYVHGQDCAPPQLIARADEAFYRAKHLGRNRSVCV